ncbi:IclR family transcriptional regulator [Mycetocola sp. 2940]|uniref:IclR family transcriptional regulator n=1 Tax=Mycetocola sp. 2940 TaxID=3156452 RepID=UPI00339842A4
MTERDGTLLGSVQRAIALVDIVANAQRPLPVKVIARQAGLTLGTTYNIVRTLVHEGFLTHEPDGIVLGPRFPGLFPQETDGVFLARIRTALRAISEDLGAAACFSRWRDGEIEAVDLVEYPQHPRLEFWVGLQHSAHATALGKRILGDLETEDRLDYLSRHPLETFTPNTIGDRTVLLQQLDAHRCASVDVEEYLVGFNCLAVPVQAPGLIGSLAITAPADSAPVDVAQLVKRMQAAASRLSLSVAADRLG